MKKHTLVHFPFVVSARFSEPDFRHLVAMATTGRRTVSQTIRILLEAALRDPRPAA